MTALWWLNSLSLSLTQSLQSRFTGRTQNGRESGPHRAKHSRRTLYSNHTLCVSVQVEQFIPSDRRRDPLQYLVYCCYNDQPEVLCVICVERELEGIKKKKKTGQAVPWTQCSLLELERTASSGRVLNLSDMFIFKLYFPAYLFSSPATPRRCFCHISTRYFTYFSFLFFLNLS